MDEFIKQLQQEANLHRKLNTQRMFPQELDGLTSFIGLHAWQTVLSLSIITAILMYFL